MLRIYLVEDNPIIRENLSETLDELVGARIVGVAETELDATEWLKECVVDWDLAIVDLFLKRGSGMRVVSDFRQRTATQKLVVLSNYASPEVRTECLRLVADHVFDKSADVDALIDFCKSMASSPGLTKGPNALPND